MHRIPLGPLHYEFHRGHEPRLRVPSGETILFETEDALSGQIKAPGDRRDKSKVPYSNPLTGPVWIEAAEPGDSISVAILDIQPSRGQCATYTGHPRQLSEWLGTDCPHGAHVCPIADGLVHWSDSLAITYDPMIGCLGTTPDWGSPTTAPPGPHGGNLDLIEVRPGNTIHLPVFVPGGRFYLGDAHAAMGHGELSATGLEMASETTVRIDLRKGKTIPGPRIESPEELMAVAGGTPMERSIAEASSRLILWLEADYGWDRWRAYDLLTHVARISVGHYAAGTVAVKLARRYLAPPQ